MFGHPLIADDNLNATPIMIMLENGCELNLWSTLGHRGVAAELEDNIQIYFPATAGGNYETWPLTLTYSPAARFVSITPLLWSTLTGDSDVQLTIQQFVA